MTDTETVEPAFVDLPHSITRRTIARKLTEAKATTPHFYVARSCRMDALLGLRKRHNAAAAIPASVNDFVVRAAALALAECPDANVTWTDTALRRHSAIDVSVAVSTPRGLITPIVRAAQSKSVEAISDEIRALAVRAREGKLRPEEYNGGTTTVSNLGMFGVEAFSAILNPPQATIFAVGAAERQPVAVGDSVEIASVMRVTLSVDHRSIDGEAAARLLHAFKVLIEDPDRLM